MLLDYGEVLCHLPTAEHIAVLAGIFQVEAEAFLPMYLKTRIPYDRGDLLPELYDEWLYGFRERFRNQLPQRNPLFSGKRFRSPEKRVRNFESGLHPLPVSHIYGIDCANH